MTDRRTRTPLPVRRRALQVDVLKLHGEDGDEVETVTRGADGSRGDDRGGEVVKMVILDANRHEVPEKIKERGQISASGLGKW